MRGQLGQKEVALSSGDCVCELFGSPEGCQAWVQKLRYHPLYRRLRLLLVPREPLPTFTLTPFFERDNRGLSWSKRPDFEGVTRGAVFFRGGPFVVVIAGLDPVRAVVFFEAASARSDQIATATASASAAIQPARWLPKHASSFSRTAPPPFSCVGWQSAAAPTVPGLGAWFYLGNPARESTGRMLRLNLCGFQMRTKNTSLAAGLSLGVVASSEVDVPWGVTASRAP